MSIEIDFSFAIDGFYHSVNYYRSTTPMNPESMPAATATGITGTTYTDVTATQDTTYYVRFGSVRGGVEKISNEYLVETSIPKWNETSVVMQHISDAANAYHNLESTATRSAMGADLSGTSKFYGAVLAPNGKIYCIPFNSTDILIIDPVANTATRSNMGASLSDTNKFFGAVLAPNGKIYCVPSASTDILIIDPVANTATRSNMGADLSGTNKWAGGVLGANGKIYCAPRGSASFLVIDPVSNTAAILALGLAGMFDTNKFIGDVLAPNGKIYCVPFNSTDIAIIDKNASVPALDIKDCLSPHLNKF